VTRTLHPFTALTETDASAVLKSRAAAIQAVVSKPYDTHSIEESKLLNKDSRDSIVFAVLHQGLKDDAITQAISHLLESIGVLQQRTAILSRCLWDDKYREQLVADVHKSLPPPAPVEPVAEAVPAVEDDGA